MEDDITALNRRMVENHERRQQNEMLAVLREPVDPDEEIRLLEKIAANAREPKNARQDLGKKMAKLDWIQVGKIFHQVGIAQRQIRGLSSQASNTQKQQFSEASRLLDQVAVVVSQAANLPDPREQ